MAQPYYQVETVEQPDYSQTDRDSRGRFTSGNRAAIGHGTKSRDNLFLFRDCITEDDIRDLATMLLAKAKQGDINAIKILLTYCLPQPAVLFKVDERRRNQESNYVKYGYPLE